MAKDYVVLAAVGDTATGPEPPESIFELVKADLQAADIRFAQVERLYSERGSYQGQGIAPHARQHPRMATAYLSVPFDVLGAGSNHVGDWGPEAAEDTVESIRKLGIKTVAAGRNIEDARTPAIVEKEGYRVAFLGYVTVLLPQYWATETRAGGTPMRARTYYEPYEYQPGSPPRIITVPHQQDMEEMVADIQKAKNEADLVVVSFHWGVHFTPKPIPMYMPVVAHAAIDAGACAILGHHPHVVQAAEAYKGAVIFYSLGNFSFYRRPGSPNYCLPNGEYEFKDAYTREMDPDYTYEWNKYFGESGIAYLELDRAGVRKATYAPTVMNEMGQPKVYKPGEPQFEESRKYFNWISREIPGGIAEVGVEGDRLLLYQR